MWCDSCVAGGGGGVFRICGVSLVMCLVEFVRCVRVVRGEGVVVVARRWEVWFFQFVLFVGVTGGSGRR